MEPLSTFPDCRTSWNFLCRLWRQRDPSWDGTEGAASQTLGSPKEQLELETELNRVNTVMRKHFCIIRRTPANFLPDTTFSITPIAGMNGSFFCLANTFSLLWKKHFPCERRENGFSSQREILQDFSCASYIIPPAGIMDEE